MLFAHWNICCIPSEVGWAASTKDASTRFMLRLSGSYWNEAVSHDAFSDVIGLEAGGTRHGARIG